MNFEKGDLIKYKDETCIFIEERGLKSLIRTCGKLKNVWNHEIKGIPEAKRKEEKKPDIYGLSDVELEMEMDFLGKMSKNYQDFYHDFYDNFT